ncbi:hypothetical protein [Aquibacillus kalidii]|nr:hypothetical protein [Aquibacillus kalidii]
MNCTQYGFISHDDSVGMQYYILGWKFDKNVFVLYDKQKGS